MVRILKLADLSWAVLYFLSIHVCGVAIYAFYISHHRRFDKNCRAGLISSWYNGFGHSKLRRIFDSEVINEAMVSMDLIYQSSTTTFTMTLTFQVSYAFESLMANEFANQNVPCAALVPPYPNANIANQVCLVTGTLSAVTHIKFRRRSGPGNGIWG